MVGAANQVTVSAESQMEIAQEQLNIEEKQRVLGVFPNYYVSYDPDPEPLTARQKFQLAWKTSIDPVTWMMSGAFAGVEQATNTFSGYGQGAQGYGKRFGANYADGLSEILHRRRDPAFALQAGPALLLQGHGLHPVAGPVRASPIR